MNNPINRIDREELDAFSDYVGTDMLLNTLDRYQAIAIQSAIYPGKGTPFGLMYAALGLAEAGEVQNKAKKAFRDDELVDIGGVITTNVVTMPDGTVQFEKIHAVKFNPITPERRAQLIKELGGNLWYIAAVCDELGVKLSEVALANLTELCGRGERGTLQGSGDDR